MARRFAQTALVHALLFAGLLAVAASAEAQQPGAPGEAVTVVDPIDIPPEHDPLAHAWDIPGQRGGFYLRASTSIGFNSTRLGPAAWQDDTYGTVKGFGSGYGVDIGGFLRPWLALHLDTHLGVLWNGSVDYGFETSHPDRARVLAYGIAPAITVFTPRDFWFKPAFGVGMATVKQGNSSYTTNPGFYMHMVFGKDLYTDDNFSFGLQFEIAYMLLGDDDKNKEARIRQFLFGVSLGFNSI